MLKVLYTSKNYDTHIIRICIIWQCTLAILLEGIEGLRGHLRCAPEAPPADEHEPMLQARRYDGR